MIRTGTSADEAFLGGTGSDSIDGGGGVDVLTYSGLPAGYDLTFVFTGLSSATVTKLDAGMVTGTDTVSGITTFIGGPGADLFDLSGSLGAASITSPVLFLAGG